MSRERLIWETGEPPIEENLMVECDMVDGNVEQRIGFLDSHGTFLNLDGEDCGFNIDEIIRWIQLSKILELFEEKK